MELKETNEILKKLRDYGFEIIDLQKGNKEQMDIFNILIISEEYFNEKVNEALESINAVFYISQDQMTEITRRDNIDRETLQKCSKCNLYFSTDFEGSTDRPELCDDCWSKL